MGDVIIEYLIRLFVGLLLGGILGSFLTMLTYRWPRGKSIVAPRSYCPACQKKIDWKDMVPVYSYLMLKGKCSNCKKPYGRSYLVIETVSMTVTTLVFLLYGFTFQAFMLIIVFGVLYTIGIIMDRQGKDKDLI
ncbi:MAG: prepilin peptidase [Proteobacteria bacterium]|nr:prepilin peptidase [Pseudomonadota bacterium]